LAGTPAAGELKEICKRAARDLEKGCRIQGEVDRASRDLRTTTMNKKTNNHPALKVLLGVAGVAALAMGGLLLFSARSHHGTAQSPADSASEVRHRDAARAAQDDPGAPRLLPARQLTPGQSFVYQVHDERAVALGASGAPHRPSP
jgi:hypothetical protein